MRWSTGEGSAAHLRFHSRTPSDGEDHFLLTPFDEPNVRGLRDQDLPLVPLHDLQQRFSGAFSDGRAIGTFRRAASVRRRLRLFGPGDPFIDALFDFTEVDDRGRRFAVCRAHPAWRGRDEALAWLFDLQGGGRPRARMGAVADPDGSAAPFGDGPKDISRPRWLGLAHQRRSRNHAEGLLRSVNSPYSERAGDRTIVPEHWDRLLAQPAWRGLVRDLPEAARPGP